MLLPSSGDFGPNKFFNFISVLYMLVFGESVLNDAASVVLYRTFDHLPPDNINVEQIGLGIASFFVVSIGGTLIGKEAKTFKSQKIRTR